MSKAPRAQSGGFCSIFVNRKKTALTVREGFGCAQAMLSAYGPQYRIGKSTYNRSGVRVLAFAWRSGGGRGSREERRN
jgi:hypothetical protein